MLITDLRIETNANTFVPFLSFRIELPIEILKPEAPLSNEEMGKIIGTELLTKLKEAINEFKKNDPKLARFE